MALSKRPAAQKTTPDEALQQLERWCAYRERSPREVRQKISALGQQGETAEQLYQVLEADGFFDEKRYAEAFAGGKFRINQWGRVRIRQALQQQHIQPAFIESALSAISNEEYEATLLKLLRQKQAQDLPDARAKIAAFLIRRGFEQECVFSVLDSALKPDF